MIKEAVNQALYNFVASRPGAQVSIRGEVSIGSNHAAEAVVKTKLGFIEHIQKTLIGYSGGFEEGHTLTLTAQTAARLPLFGEVHRELKLGEASLNNGDQYLTLRERAMAMLPKNVSTVES